MWQENYINTTLNMIKKEKKDALQIKLLIYEEMIIFNWF